MEELPSRKLTYPPKNGILKMIFLYFPFPKVGYVNSLEGTVVDHRAFVFVFSGSSYTKFFWGGRIEVRWC